MADTPLKEQLRNDLNSARKERDRLRTTTLTTLLSEVRNREIDLGREAGDEEVLAVLDGSIKRRREAAEQMRAGGREELARRDDKNERGDGAPRGAEPAPNPEAQGGYFTRVDMNDFQPAGEVKLRIVSRGGTDEK